MARAADEDRRGPGRPRQDEAASLCVLIHGDASFPGQGVVAESLNISRLAGYRTGGTLHLIANNQLGFTTEPRDDRSTLYASDLAKGFEMPIVHINADDPIACLAAVRLATAYRAEFGKDFLIDLIGYRRWGHNEGDDPSFTQPRMYGAISHQRTVREKFAADLVARGVLTQGEPEAFLKAGLDEFQRIRDEVRQRPNGRDNGVILSAPKDPSPGSADPSQAQDVKLDWDALKSLNQALLTFPDGFNVHAKLDRALQRRRVAFDRPDAPIDWAHAETLAFATIVRDGTPVRLTGQDAIRGTFSQRHLSFFDARTGAQFTPLDALADSPASFEVHNSPLSETAALGFEYGYSVQAPEVLVLWEGQYGDFINGAQVIVDEFVVSGQAKWGLVSGLVLLLPHAWEGQGPDHSGARLERFLDMAAEDNIRVANCTTAAQYFWLLRRQAASLADDPRPLVVMTPKSLLRHPLAASRSANSPTVHSSPHSTTRVENHPNRVQRLVLCSGTYGPTSNPTSGVRATTPGRAARQELYPLRPTSLPKRSSAIRMRAGHLAAEEPRNMGAWP
jgi:2-oxoglutarate dehydrogenase E1 component